MKTTLLTTLLAASPSFALAAGAPADQALQPASKAPYISIQAEMPRAAETVLRIVPAPAWGVTFAGLPLSTWTAPSIEGATRAPVTSWSSPAATPAITLLSIRF